MDASATPAPAGIRIYGPLLAAAAVVVALDQLTKTWALNALDEGPIELIPGVLHLRLTFNSGGAFGLLQGIPGFFLLASLVVAVLILAWARRVEDARWIVPLGMILGGGLGNVVDRLFRGHDGQVVDFIDLQIWPVFNLADSSIVIGVLLILLFGARSGEPPDESG